MRLIGALVMVLVLFPVAIAFHPTNLGPDHFLESVPTYPNPWTAAECTGTNDPIWGCSGPGTGSLTDPIGSFHVVSGRTRNIDCTAPGIPNACCTGAGSGTCAYEEGDQGFGQNSYCNPACSDGCIFLWRDQAKYKGAYSYSPTGRGAEQDDLEQPCYIASCTPSGQPCIEGQPPWTEPGYPLAEQPKQDSVLELEPYDRNIPACPGEAYHAQLVWVDASQAIGNPPGSVQQAHYLFKATLMRVLDQGSERLMFTTSSTAFDLSASGMDLLAIDGWYFIEIRRNSSNHVQLWIDGVERTKSPAPVYTGTKGWGPGQWFCRGKNCNATTTAEAFFGRAAMNFYKCGMVTDANRSDMLQYAQSTFLGSSCHWADSDCNNDISISELVTVVLDWQSGSRSISELVEVVLLWQA